MMVGIIYLIQNKVNGKMYVGQTLVGLPTRWSGHKRPSNITPLGRAIQKYGPEAFVKSVLARGEEGTELDNLEKHWIRELKTLTPNGYNIFDGRDQTRSTLDRLAAIQKARLALREVMGHPKGPSNFMASDIVGIFARFNNGEKQKDIARDLGVDRSTIAHILKGSTWKHLGLVATAPRHTRITESLAREVWNTISSGLSRKEVATKLGLLYSTVLRIVKGEVHPLLLAEYGGRPDSEGRFSEKQIAEAKRLRALGLSYEVIGKQMGISLVTVWKHCRDGKKKIVDKRTREKQSP